MTSRDILYQFYKPKVVSVVVATTVLFVLKFEKFNINTLQNDCTNVN